MDVVLFDDGNNVIFFGDFELLFVNIILVKIIFGIGCLGFFEFFIGRFFIFDCLNTVEFWLSVCLEYGVIFFGDISEFVFEGL